MQTKSAYPFTAFAADMNIMLKRVSHVDLSVKNLSVLKMGGNFYLNERREYSVSVLLVPRSHTCEWLGVFLFVTYAF